MAVVVADVVGNASTSVVAGGVTDSGSSISSSRKETDDANKLSGFRTVPPDFCMTSMYSGTSSPETVSIAVNVPFSFIRASLRFLIGR